MPTRKKEESTVLSKGKRSLVLIFGALLLLLCSGIPLFFTPANEITYSTSQNRVPCFDTGCLTLYTLVLGNTGKENQDITVVFSANVLAQAMLKPTVLNFGKVPRHVNIRDEGEQIYYVLDNVAPHTRIDIQFAFNSKASDAAPEWNEILERVEASKGQVVQGSPEFVTFGRFLYSVFDLFSINTC